MKKSEHMFVTDFYTNVLAEAKTSFIFGTLSASVEKIFNKDENENVIYNQYRAIKEGIYFTQYNILYTATKYLLKFYDLNDTAVNYMSLFFTAFMIGLRNGREFAIKNGIISMCFHLYQKLINKFTT